MRSRTLASLVFAIALVLGGFGMAHAGHDNGKGNGGNNNGKGNGKGSDPPTAPELNLTNLGIGGAVLAGGILLLTKRGANKK